ncbi:DLW-39 family protein [Rothia sp. P6271]
MKKVLLVVSTAVLGIFLTKKVQENQDVKASWKESTDSL